MPTPDDDDLEQLTEAVIDGISDPRVVEVDGMRVEQQSLRDKIAAAEFIARQVAARRTNGGLIISRVVGPGNV